jgi:nucleoid-associated protein YgaU
MRTVAMVSQKKKLTAAGAVLAVGLGLACAFPNGRVDGPQSRQPGHPTAPPPQTIAAATALDGQFSPLPVVPAILAGTSQKPADFASVDSPNVPALSDESSHPAAPPLHAEIASSGRPVYQSVEDSLPGGSDESPSPFRIHIVHNGDTLERLAERYLGDGARSLEIFDLNRDVLENPHLLRIGVELRIPRTSSADEP